MPFADLAARGPLVRTTKYAITMAMLPHPSYRHAFELGCSVGVLTEPLAARCDHVTSTDIAEAALAGPPSGWNALGVRRR